MGRTLFRAQACVTYGFGVECANDVPRVPQHLAGGLPAMTSEESRERLSRRRQREMELPGHNDLTTTMISTPFLNRELPRMRCPVRGLNYGEERAKSTETAEPSH